MGGKVHVRGEEDGVGGAGRTGGEAGGEGGGEGGGVEVADVTEMK